MPIQQAFDWCVPTSLQIAFTYLPTTQRFAVHLNLTGERGDLLGEAHWFLGAVLPHEALEAVSSALGDALDLWTYEGLQAGIRHAQRKLATLTYPEALGPDRGLDVTNG
jgi:hypothetical protein